MTPRTIKVSVVFSVTCRDNDPARPAMPVSNSEVVAATLATLRRADLNGAFSDLDGTEDELPCAVWLQFKPVSASQI